MRSELDGQSDIVDKTEDYILLKERLNAERAKVRCEELNAHLVTAYDYKSVRKLLTYMTKHDIEAIHSGVIWSHNLLEPIFSHSGSMAANKYFNSVMDTYDWHNLTWTALIKKYSYLLH